MFDMIDLPVRFAGPEDEAELLRLCRSKHEEENLRKPDGSPFVFSEERCRATLHKAIIPNRNHPTTSWCGVIGDVGGDIQSSVFLSIQQPYDSDDQYLLERWSWIYPEFRKGTENAKLLWSFSQAIAKELNMIVIGGVVSEDDDPAKLRFYKRNGATRLGAMYVFSHGVN